MSTGLPYLGNSWATPPKVNDNASKTNKERNLVIIQILLIEKLGKDRPFFLFLQRL
jgi:hypothetical protein